MTTSTASFNGKLALSAEVFFGARLGVNQTRNAFSASLSVEAPPIPQVATVHVYVDDELVVCDNANPYGYEYGYCPIDPPVPSGIEPYGADPLFFASGGVLPPLEDGLHRLRIEVVATTGNIFVERTTFLVDTTPPEVTLISPENNLVDYFADPILEYTTFDATSGVGFIDVVIDGVSHGHITSGTPLIGLKDGLHTLSLHVQDLAKDDNGVGNETVVTVQFLTATDFSIDSSGKDTIGTIDASTGQVAGFTSYAYIGSDEQGFSQADGILEEMRVLDKASSDADVLSDYKLLLNGFRFQNTTDDVVLSPEDQVGLQAQGIDIQRLNQPDHTLLLFHFDNSIQSVPGVGAKEQVSNVIISTTASRNDVDVLVRVPAGEVVDREFVDYLLQKISSIHTQIFTTFEEVEES